MEPTTERPEWLRTLYAIHEKHKDGESVSTSRSTDMMVSEGWGAALGISKPFVYDLENEGRVDMMVNVYEAFERMKMQQPAVQTVCAPDASNETFVRFTLAANGNNKIQAIKALRERVTGLGLREAKNFVEAVVATPLADAQAVIEWPNLDDENNEDALPQGLDGAKFALKLLADPSWLFADSPPQNITDRTDLIGSLFENGRASHYYWTEAKAEYDEANAAKIEQFELRRRYNELVAEANALRARLNAE